MTRPHRAHFVVAATLALAALVASAPTFAQAFPSRPVTVIVPYAPGGGTDGVARVIARELSAEWGQPVVVENRPGADGWLGTQRMLQLPADGYTLLVQLNSMLLWRWALPEAKIDIANDLRLITKMQSSPVVAIVRGNAPAASLREMFEHCRTRGKPCSFGISTVSAQLVARQLAAAGGLADAAIVPYKGTAPMTTDLLGGHIDIALISATLAVPLAADGRAKALGVGTPERFPKLPDTPTYAQAGYPVRSGNTWYGLMVRAGTPDSAVDTISTAVARAGRKPEVIAAIEAQGGVPGFNSADAFTREVLDELQGIAPVAERYLKPEAK